MAESLTMIYESRNGTTKLDTVFDGKTVWLANRQIAELYDVDASVVNKHIANIIDEGEVDADVAISRMEVARQVNGRNVAHIMSVFNLDMILSVGYRIDAEQAAAFNDWATSLPRVISQN